MTAIHLLCWIDKWEIEVLSHSRTVIDRRGVAGGVGDVWKEHHKCREVEGDDENEKDKDKDGPASG